MNGLFEVVLEKINRHWIIWLAVFVVSLSFIYWRQYQGWRRTDEMITRLRESAATSERRTNAIIDATKQREVTARAQAKKQAAALSPDELVSAIDRLLSEYRAGR